MRLGVDIGGTFTDAVVLDEGSNALKLSKVPSTPQDFSRGVIHSTQQLLPTLDGVNLFIHGTTVGLNALLQGRVCLMGMLTTKGFRDIIELGRGNRINPYDLFYRVPSPLVPRRLRQEIPERIDAEGNVIEPLDETVTREAIQRLLNEGVDGIVVAFINSYKNPKHELRAQQLVAELAGPRKFCSISSAITQEYREYERFNTALINMAITPPVRSYLQQLSRRAGELGLKREVLIVQSNGGTMSSAIAADRPVLTLQSTLAGGMVGLETVSRALNLSHVVGADMGGTSFDIGCVVQGEAQVIASYKVKTPTSGHDGYRVLAPQVDVESIGAGGGSIAWIDRGGALHVGPQSASADPGPACYGLGGEDPTVTDANVVLGRLNPEGLLGGRMKIDPDLSHRAVNRIAGRLGLTTEEAAAGILEIVNSNMAGMTKMYLLKRGHDPRDFILVGYGGAGPLHGVAIADELSIPKVLIVNSPGNFSAWGMLMTDFKHDFARTWIAPVTSVDLDRLSRSFDEMEREGQELLRTEGVADADVRFLRGMDVRYLGQLHSFTVPVPAGRLDDSSRSAVGAKFDELHQAMYLHSAPSEPKEIVSLRLTAVGVIGRPELALIPEGQSFDASNAKVGARKVFFGGGHNWLSCPIYSRDRLLAGNRLAGPAIVEELTSTTVVPPGWAADVDRFGHLLVAPDRS